MAIKAIAGIAVLAVALYLGYGSFMKGAEDAGEKNIRASFQSMNQAIVSKNKQAISNLISPAFTDNKTNRNKLVELLTQPRKSYRTVIKSVNVNGPLAVVNYTRSQTFENQEPVSEQIVGETWQRDGKNELIWRLFKLAGNDKGFRGTTPMVAAKSDPAKEGTDGVATESSEPKMETSAEPKKQWRYASFGRRDPFKPLIELDDEIKSIEAICDPSRDREILENYDLMSLKITGIIKSGDENLALIKAPDGKGYSVRKEQYLGKKCGKVLSVMPDHLLIQEQKLFRDDIKRKPGKPAPSVFKPVESKLKLRPEEG